MIVLDVVMTFIRIRWMMRMIMIMRVAWMIIPKRNAFKTSWGTSYRFRLAERNVVWCFTFEY